MRKWKSSQKKRCLFCDHDILPDYKNEDMMKRFITDRGKILPRKATGTCALHQRKVAAAIKRSRHIALLPFVSENIH